MKLKINEVSKLTGITVRTLHYYDEIDLLKPSEVTDTGYRIYDDEAIQRLQEILFFRELEFSLNEIKALLTSSSYNRKEALLKHKELLLIKQKRLDGLIQLVNDTLEGEEKMNFKPFDMSEIEKAKEAYSEEVKERWGQTDAYRESAQKTKHYQEADWKEINEKSGEIFKAFNELKTTDPTSETAHQLVKKWQDYITQYFYQCTDDILAGLGLMYVYDERFKENIDQYGEGTAQFMSDAIASYCKK